MIQKQLSEREQRILRLVSAAADALANEAAGASADDIFSACFELARRSMLIAQDQHVSLEGFRSTLEGLYAMLPREKKPS